MQNSRLEWIEGEVGQRGRGLSLMAHNGGLQMMIEVTGEKCAEKGVGVSHIESKQRKV